MEDQGARIFPGRGAGILMPAASLRGTGPDYGFGSLGRGAEEFAQFLRAAGQTYWQVLPVGPISQGDSPYQSFSAFAGNPYLIDLPTLYRQKLLTRAELAAAEYHGAPDRIDYGWLFRTRFPVLRKAFARSRHAESAEYAAFCRDNAFWLDDYGLFMALKVHFQQKIWLEWPEDIRLREPDAMARYRELLSGEIAFWTYLQFEFFRQWTAFRAMLRGKGITLIGDMPIYVALDAVEPWALPFYFDLDASRHPRSAAGVPPDYFSKTGQLWGNPLYAWDKMAEDGYRFWIERLTVAARLFDVLRIDHFRGFAEYYAVPAGAPTAEHGAWKPGPGMALFRAISNALPELRLIAEDLGVQSEGLGQLLRETGYPNMKVLQFAFDSDGHNPFLPHQYIPNCVVYTGTHDNDTTRGFFDSATRKLRASAAAYLRLPAGASSAALTEGLVAAAYQSVADTAIIPIQDILGQGGEARINRPATVGSNWRYRLPEAALTSALAKETARMVKRYGRDNTYD